MAPQTGMQWDKTEAEQTVARKALSTAATWVVRKVERTDEMRALWTVAPEDEVVYIRFDLFT